ncbi:MAG: hypothetical protein ACLU6Y_08715 [Ruminococcus sp.]
MSGNRYLPWYFLAKLSEKILCFGVKVRPSAMCYWQADTKGITSCFWTCAAEMQEYS